MAASSPDPLRQLKTANRCLLCLLFCRPAPLLSLSGTCCAPGPDQLCVIHRALCGLPGLFLCWGALNWIQLSQRGLTSALSGDVCPSLTQTWVFLLPFLQRRSVDSRSACYLPDTQGFSCNAAISLQAQFAQLHGISPAQQQDFAFALAERQEVCAAPFWGLLRPLSMSALV